MSKILLEANNIGKSYLNYNIKSLKKIMSSVPFFKKYDELQLFNNVNLKLYCGSSIGVTGKNETILNILLNILQETTKYDTGFINKNAHIIKASDIFSDYEKDIIKYDDKQSTNYESIIEHNIFYKKNIIFIFDEINLDKRIIKDYKIIIELVFKINPNNGVICILNKNSINTSLCSTIINIDQFTNYTKFDTANLKDAIFLKQTRLVNSIPIEDTSTKFYSNVHTLPIKASEAKPIAIGGVGGSGTRLIAEMLKETGIYIGDDLNKASDNLWFTFLFKHQHLLKRPYKEIGSLIEIFFHAMLGSNIWEKSQIETIQQISSTKNEDRTSNWNKKRESSLLCHKTKLCTDLIFGWKEPNTHLFIKYFKIYFNNIKYIHVCRNGLDMAHSKNQNQVKFWGKYFIQDMKNLTPRESLKFWCLANKRTIQMCNKFNIDYIIVNYDKLCTEKNNELCKIASFIGADTDMISKFERIIKKPSSIGRYKKFGIDMFDCEDVNYVSSLGFETE